MKRLLLVLLAMLFSIVALAQQERGIRTVAKDPETGSELVVYRNLWAVIIGIDKYDYWPPLSYAVRDAEAVAEMLKTKFGFRNDQVILLRNHEATLHGIKSALGEMINLTGEDDGVLFFFAGHGQTFRTREGREMGYLIPAEGKTENTQLYSTALPMSEVKNLSNLIPAKHILFLVDACYGGLAAASEYRGLLSATTEGFLRKVVKAKTRHVITAGGAGEQVLESDEWGHSAFTYELLNALARDQADLSNDGITTADELAEYLTHRVSAVTNNRQLPQSRRLSSDEGKFVFVKAEEKEGVATAREEQLRASQDDLAPAMLLIPSGRFEMGSADGSEDEKPVHSVELGTFYLDRYEVTNQEFQKFVNDAKYKPEGNWKRVFHFGEGRKSSG